ncbi:hypothetical protein [Thermaerobacillus caldiproteolyticus]|uniref:Uncharacterized protein n=1 Tax=Thermaerobacillus caldiproteolyticus TaxID=247480 RepID=A0A7W0BYF2_9BACL|nr:hypothetical protein [Anoxybacillus caldiproteolyticus]MBA2874510.1 hypothetical protein [Anoxybacillus caldiproteolyticus]
MKIRIANNIKGLSQHFWDSALSSFHRQKRISMQSYFSLLSETKTTVEKIEDIRENYDRLVQKEIKRKTSYGELFRKQPVDGVSTTNKIIHRGVYPEESIKIKL